MKNQPLQHQFRVWTFLLVLVPSLLIMSIYTVGQIRMAKENNLELISQRVDFQKRLINRWIDERANDVRSLSRLAAFRVQDRERMRDVLGVMQAGNPDFDSLSFINQDGLFVLSTLSTGIKFPSTVNQPYFQAAATGNEYISDIVIGRNSGQPIINFSSPVYDYDGKFLGLILGSVRTTTMENLLRQNWIGDTGEILLVNRAGIMIAEPRYGAAIAARDAGSAGKMKLKLSEETLRTIHLGGSGSAEWNDYQNSRVIGAYLDMPERSWTLIGSIAEKEILEPIYIQLGRMASGTFLLVLLMIPLASYLTGRVKRPIEWLVEQSDFVAAEDYELVQPDNRLEQVPSELAHLCRTFLRMSRKIQNTVGLLKQNEAQLASKVLEIEEINAVLEEEIEERQRTQAALEKLNAELEDTVLKRTESLRETNRKLHEEIDAKEMVQAALRDSKERYEVLLKQSAEAIAIIDFDTRGILEVNAAFSRMFAYEEQAVQGRDILDFGLLERGEMVAAYGALMAEKVWQSPIRRYRCHDGRKVYAGLSAALIRHRGQDLILLSYRDITEQQQLQARMREQVELAGTVQRSLLPPEFEDRRVRIRTLFQPVTWVSGDFLGYRWSHDGEKLHGYVLDVTGHGIAAALYTSAISSLLGEMLDEEQAWTRERLIRLNHHLLSYLQDDSFVALLVFTLDLAAGQLTCIACGINYILAAGGGRSGLVAIPGMYLGITPEPEMDILTLPVAPGDTLYFMTDGYYEGLPPDIAANAAAFDETVEALRNLEERRRNHDDCSAICLEIK